MVTTSYRIFQKDVWDPRIDAYFKMALVAAPHFYNVSDLVVPGALTVRIPKIGDSFSAVVVGATTGVVSNQAVADTATTVTLDRWLAAKVRFTDFELATISRSYNLRDEYAKAMAQKVAQQADKELLALVKSVSRIVNDTTTALISADLEAAMGIVESYYCPREQLTWFFTPKAFWGELMGIQKYYDASQFGKTVTPTGDLYTLYGVPVVITNNLPVFTAGSTKKVGFLGVPTTAAFAFANLEGGTQGGVRLTEIPKSGGNLITDVITDIAFGVKIMNVYHGVKIYSTGM